MWVLVYLSSFICCRYFDHLTIILMVILAENKLSVSQNLSTLLAMIAPFSCPTIYSDTNSQCYFVPRHLNNAWHNNTHLLAGTPCLTIIASNEKHCGFLYKTWIALNIANIYYLLPPLPFLLVSVCVYVWSWINLPTKFFRDSISQGCAWHLN